MSKEIISPRNAEEIVKGVQAQEELKDRFNDIAISIGQDIKKISILRDLAGEHFSFKSPEAENLKPLEKKLLIHVRQLSTVMMGAYQRDGEGRIDRANPQNKTKSKFEFLCLRALFQKMVDKAEAEDPSFGFKVADTSVDGREETKHYVLERL